jgi:hypothetical protein
VFVPRRPFISGHGPDQRSYKKNREKQNLGVSYLTCGETSLALQKRVHHQICKETERSVKGSRRPKGTEIRSVGAKRYGAVRAGLMLPRCRDVAVRASPRSNTACLALARRDGMHACTCARACPRKISRDPVPSPTSPHPGPRRPRPGPAAYVTADTCRASGSGSSQVAAIRKIEYCVPFRSAKTGC